MLRDPGPRRNFASSGILLAGLLAAPALAVARFYPESTFWLLVVGSATVSVVTAWVYWVDKNRAGTGARRVSENALHTLELFGGWPGAFLAQRHVRHKSAKVGFQVIFWLIVGAHECAAIDFLLDRQLSGRAMTWVRGLASP